MRQAEFIHKALVSILTDRGALVVIEGRSPIWRYGVAFHKLHGSPAGAIAVYDPRLGAVVVASHSPHFAEGQVIDVLFPPTDRV